MLADFLESNNVNAQLIETTKQVHSAKQAAAAMGCPLSHVLNSIVFMDSENSPWLVLMPADARVDVEKLEKAAGKKGMRLAQSDEVEKATGYPAGGVPPISSYGIQTILDKRVNEDRVVFAGGGDDHHLLRIRVDEIKKHAEEITTADIAQ